MDALSKVTRYFRDTMDVIQATPTDIEGDGFTYSPKKDAEFEDLGEVDPNRTNPPRVRLLKSLDSLVIYYWPYGKQKLPRRRINIYNIK